MKNQNQVARQGWNEMIENFVNGNFNRFFDDTTNDHWMKTPAVNIKEMDNSYQLEVVAPGASKEDFKMNINDKTLTIAYDKKEATQEEQGKWLRNEYKATSFKRSFTIGDLVDTEHVAAKYENGILNITLPKKEAAIVTKKEIEIG